MFAGYGTKRLHILKKTKSVGFHLTQTIIHLNLFSIKQVAQISKDESRKQRFST